VPLCPRSSQTGLIKLERGGGGEPTERALARRHTSRAGSEKPEARGRSFRIFSTKNTAGFKGQEGESFKEEKKRKGTTIVHDQSGSP